MSDTTVQETKPQSPPKQPKITSHVKEKDPRRVEAGRRLGAISKAAKERKAQQRKRVRSVSTASESSDDEKISKSEQNDHTMLYLTAAGVIVGIIGLYFTYKTESAEHHPQITHVTYEEEEEVKSKQKRSAPPPHLPNPYLRSF